MRTHPDEVELGRSMGGGHQQGAEPEPTSDWDEGLGANSCLLPPGRIGRYSTGERGAGCGEAWLRERGTRPCSSEQC